MPSSPAPLVKVCRSCLTVDISIDDAEWKDIRVLFTRRLRDVEGLRRYVCELLYISPKRFHLHGF